MKGLKPQPGSHPESLAHFLYSFWAWSITFLGSGRGPVAVSENVPLLLMIELWWGSLIPNSNLFWRLVKVLLANPSSLSFLTGTFLRFHGQHQMQTVFENLPPPAQQFGVWINARSNKANSRWATTNMEGLPDRTKVVLMMRLLSIVQNWRATFVFAHVWTSEQHLLLKTKIEFFSGECFSGRFRRIIDTKQTSGLNLDIPCGMKHILCISSMFLQPDWSNVSVAWNLTAAKSEELLHVLKAIQSCFFFR